MKKHSLLTLVALLVCNLTMVAQTTIVESPQTDVVYRLPLEKGAKVTASALSPVKMGLGHAYNLVDFCAWQLSATDASDVVAPREGIVEAADDQMVLLRHEDGLYTRLRLLKNTCVKVGEMVKKGAKVGTTSVWDNKHMVAMESFYMVANPQQGIEGAVSSQYPTLCKYFNPIFTTREQCKVLLDEGSTYTVKARAWCWPWE